MLDGSPSASSVTVRLLLRRTDRREAGSPVLGARAAWPEGGKATEAAAPRVGQPPSCFSPLLVPDYPLQLPGYAVDKETLSGVSDEGNRLRQPVKPEMQCDCLPYVISIPLIPVSEIKPAQRR